MNFKVNSLFEKIYKDFIAGVYGPPKIPSKQEVIKKMDEITTQEYVPITKFSPAKDIDIKEIAKNFSTTIDDLDILFDSIEQESRAVLDQLTYSLKEHNGSKREIKQLKSAISDIENGKLGDDILGYNFTETFESLEDINTTRSDPVDISAGEFSIGRGIGKALTFNHYFGHKLEFTVLERYAEILENNYVGSADASVIMDPRDSRSLVYRYKMSRPTRLRVAFSLQLTPDARLVDVNSVIVNIDSSASKGKLRLSYLNNYAWKDIPGLSIQDIKSDRIVFTFPTTQCTHLKFEWIKDAPDISDSNEYFFVINHISVFQATSKRIARLYSNPISFTSYSLEDPVITSIQASGDIYKPNNTDVKLYVSKDIKVSGKFVDIFGDIVDPKSVSVHHFDPNQSGYVFLSDIYSLSQTISGVEQYRSVDFDWKPLKIYEDQGRVPDSVEFNISIVDDLIDNSIYSLKSFVWGDSAYSGLYSYSGWCNSSNPKWSELQVLVNSGVLVAGVDVASLVGVDYYNIEDEHGNLHPQITGNANYSGQWLGYGSGQGFPWNYQLPNVNRTIRWGEPISEIPGWWRPLCHAVTPTGISLNYLDDDIYTLRLNSLYTLPDFYFNGLGFYKIFKFGSTNKVIESSIKLYTFHEKPLIVSGTYDCEFLWNYKNTWDFETKSLTRQKLADKVNFSGYKIGLDSLNINEEYVPNSIFDLKINGTNDVLNISTDWEYIFNSDGTLSGINLSPLVNSRPYLDSVSTYFDYKIKLKIQNKYQSTWTGYAIVDSLGKNGKITINNDIITSSIGSNTNDKVIKSIKIENIDTNFKWEISGETDVLVIDFLKDTDNRTGNKHYKITIYCASDSDTGFSAKGSNGNSWVPVSKGDRSTISLDPGIKIVSSLVPMKVVSLSTLIYDTPNNNDRKIGIFQEKDGSKYLVVKSPSKDIFPGYYFDSIHKTYVRQDQGRITNDSHYVRKAFRGANNSIIQFTTGSSGLNPGLVYTTPSKIDRTWNNGSCLSTRPNSSGIYFPVHSTYKFPLNLESDTILESENFGVLTAGDIDPRAPYTSNEVNSAAWNLWISGVYSVDQDRLVASGSFIARAFQDVENKGFLFYSTAENLPAFYSLSFDLVDSLDDYNNRFLYKLELISDEKSSETPKVRSLTLTANKGID